MKLKNLIGFNLLFHLLFIFSLLSKLSYVFYHKFLNVVIFIFDYIRLFTLFFSREGEKIEINNVYIFL